MTPTLPSAVTKIQAEEGKSTFIDVFGNEGCCSAADTTKTAGPAQSASDTTPQILLSITLGKMLNYATFRKESCLLQRVTSV
jgi:hypothetical protein